MKTLTKFYALLSLAILLFGCKGGQKSGTGIAMDSITNVPYAVCIWDRASLKESPDDKGKWLASISLGEKCTYLDAEKEDNSGTKPVKYVKIKMDFFSKYYFPKPI